MRRRSSSALRESRGAATTYVAMSAFLAHSAAAMSLVFAKDLHLEQKPEVMNVAYALEFAATCAKPLYAYASDRGAFFGYTTSRSTHVLAGCAMTMCCVVFASRSRGVTSAIAFGVLSAAASAHASAALDGYVAEKFGDSKRHAIASQSIAMASKSAGAVIGYVASAMTMMVMSARASATASVFWLACAGAAARIGLDERHDATAGDARASEGEFERVFTSTSMEEFAKAGEGEGKNDDERGSRKRWNALLEVGFVRSAMAVFFYRVAPTALDTFAAYTYWAFQDVLANWGFAVVSLFSSVGGFAAAAAFGAAFGGGSGEDVVLGDDATRMYEPMPMPMTFRDKAREVGNRLANAPLWVLFVFCAVADATLGMCRLFIVWSPPRAGAIWALSAVEIACSFGLDLGYMPILALAAMVAPPEIEAVGFATIIFAADVGSLFSAAISAEVTRDFNLGAPTRLASDGTTSIPTGRSWSALPAFLTVVAASKIIIPLCTAPWLVRESERTNARSRVAAADRAFVDDDVDALVPFADDILFVSPRDSTVTSSRASLEAPDVHQ